MRSRIARVEYKWLVATAFVFGIFMDLLDITIVNVALPTLGKEFNASSNGLEWIVTGYLLSLAIWIPASGWLGDRIGTKKVFMFALATFVVGSALCALSWNLESMVAFRILQGVGGGMLTPVGNTMLFRAFPPAERAQASIVLTVPTVIAPALGPVLGGFFVDYVSWHWIFLVNLPIGIAGFFFTWAFVHEEKGEETVPFDVPGFVLAGGGLALILFALSRGPVEGWSSAIVLATGGVGVVMALALVIVELKSRHPMLDLRLLGDRMFRNANIVFFTMIGGLMGVVFLLPLLLQNLRGLSAMDTGLLLMPQAVAVMVFAPLSGKLYPKVGPKRMLAFSLVVFAISSFMFVAVDLETNLLWLLPIMVLRGLAMAFTFIPLQAAAFATIKPQDTGMASSIFNTNRQVASSIGIAILATVLTERTAHHISGAATEAAAQQGALLGFHDAFIASGILAIIGIFFALIIHDEDAAASMQGFAVEGEAEPAMIH
ncbi:MAG: MDR family MFS transporter [Dehalococcoidia bacterium]